MKPQASSLQHHAILLPLQHMNIRFSALFLICTAFLASCDLNPLQMQLAPGWKTQSITAWKNTRPDMIAISPSGKWMYVACEINQSLLAPSLIAINLKSLHQQVLVYGLHRADGLKFAPDGSLWIGEEHKKGLIWRIAEPDKLPEEQRVDRDKLRASHAAIAPLMAAGTFAHEGITFSLDGKYAYLADEWKEGCIFRLNMKTHELMVFHKDKGWLLIKHPDEARVEAEILHATYFNRPEDMEIMPDGTILIAETDTGRILQLDDRGEQPTISSWLTHADLMHPDNLEWDDTRDWLWITDDSQPSYLWAWDGRRLLEIVRHDSAEITGVIVHQGDVYFNIQQPPHQTEALVKLTYQAAASAL